MGPSRHVRRALFIALALLAVAVLAAVLFPKRVLCVDSGKVNADAIVLLGGGAGERPPRAAELFREGAAPKVIVSGEGDCGYNQQVLLKSGVPADAIQVEPNSRNTRENAAFTVPLLRSLGAKRVIIVTSWYHSRRAWRCFAHEAPDVTFLSRPAYGTAENRADSIEGNPARKSRVRLEYLKLLGYWVRYGIAPF